MDDHISYILILTFVDITGRLHAMFYKFFSRSTGGRECFICWFIVIFHIPVGISLIIVVVSIWIDSSESSCTIKSIWTEYILHSFPWTLTNYYWSTPRVSSCWSHGCSSEGHIGESISVHSFCLVVTHDFLAKRFYTFRRDICSSFE